MTDTNSPTPRRRTSRPGNRQLERGATTTGKPFAEVTTRNDITRDLIAGFAAVTPNSAGVWRYVDRALAYAPATPAELDRVQAGLEAVRLDRANLLAAIRATLG